VLNEEWFTGFCEGDGSVSIQKSPRLVKVQLGQKDESPIRYVYECVGFGVFGYAQTEDYYYLIFNGKKCVSLLEILSRYVVSLQTVKRLNVALSEFGMPSSVTHEPVMDWVVGFWDAEGGSSLGGYLGSQLYVIIYQKEREVLDAIHRFMCCGSVQEHTNRNGEPMHCWAVSGKKAFELACVLLERSHCDKKRGMLNTHVDEYLTRKRVREWMKKNPERVEVLMERGGVLS